jgi:hypothetical protein
MMNFGRKGGYMGPGRGRCRKLRLFALNVNQYGYLKRDAVPGARSGRGTG